jgi:hypothetical protein
MSGPIQRESVSRCEDANSLYSTIRNHHVPRQIQRSSTDKYINEAAQPAQESVQARLNREMVNRVENIGLQLPHESFVAVVQVGKYMLLAVMLPPYLLLYGIPKWLLGTLVPEVFFFARAQCIKVGKFVQDVANKVIDLMQAAMDQTLGEALRMFKRESDRFTGAMAAMLAQMQKSLSNGAQNALGKLQGVFNAFTNGLSGSTETLQALLRRLAQQAADAAAMALKIASMVKSAAGSLKNGLERMGNFVTGFAGNISALAAWMTSHIRNGATKVSEGLSGAFERGRSFARMLSDAMEKISFENFWKKMMSFGKRIAGKAQEVGDKCREFLARTYERAEEAVTKAAQVVMKNIIAIPQATLQVVVWIYKLLPERRRAQISKFYQGGRRIAKGIVAMGRGAARGIQFVFSAVSEAYSIFMAEIRRWIAWLFKKAIQLLDFIISLPARTLLLALAIYPHVSRVFGQAAYAVRLFIALLWAIIYVLCMSLKNLLASYSLGFTRKSE